MALMIEPFVGLIAAIVLFLYGIEHLSRELQMVASDRLRKVLQDLTKNRWSGAVTGAAVTAAIQSSTATTVIAVGLVNAGIISFAQSIGIIAGANVGTTITAQLVAFHFAALAPIFIILGFVLSLARGRLRIIGKTVFYFGFLFLAIGFLSEAVGPFKQDPGVASWIAQLDDPLLAVAAGALLTMLLQSSSATTGIVVVLGAEGLLGLGAAIPIVMGANIGTTSTAILSAWRMELFAKRTAVAHALFNICGVLVFIPILIPFAGFVQALGGTTGHMIANAHALFNITTAVVFLLLMKPAIALSEKIVPGREKEVLFRTEHLEDVPENTDEALAAVKKELRGQMELVKSSFYISYGMVRKGNADRLAKVNKLETLNNHLEEKISSVLVELSERNLTSGQSEEVVLLARLSNKMEQLGDLSKAFAKLAVKLDERGEKLLPESVNELDEIKKGFDVIMGKVLEKETAMDQRTLRSMTMKRAQTEKLIQAAYRGHMKRLADRKISSQTSTIFIDAAYAIEQANSALLRIGRLLIKLKKE